MVLSTKERKTVAESQYYKRKDNSITIMHILSGKDGAEYFVKVNEHH